MTTTGAPVIEGLRVAHRGDSEIVVVKPVGLSSELTGSERGDAVLERVRHGAGWPEARLPHRLDRAARGYLLVAKDSGAAAWHSAAIRRSEWTKGYIARVEAPTNTSLVGTHKRYLRRRGRRAECVHSGGDPAILEILATAPAVSHRNQLHVAIRLVTGRFHQIRAMCAALGAPLAGDVLYGGTATLGEPMLEHAFLRFPAASGQVITLFEPLDAERESVAREILDALSGL